MGQHAVDRPRAARVLPILWEKWASQNSSSKNWCKTMSQPKFMLQTVTFLRENNFGWNLRGGQI
jgi:hypothetical protein